MLFLWIFFLQNQYCEFNTGDGRRPNQLLWCCNCTEPIISKSSLIGNVAVVLYRPGMILLIGPNKDWIKYDLDETHAFLSMDVDGIHVVTSMEHSFIQHVPSTVQETSFAV